MTGICLALAIGTMPARGASVLPDVDWASLDPLDVDGDTFLALYIGLTVIVGTVIWLLRDMACTTDRRPDMRDLGEIELACCVGGDARAADTLYLALALRGAAGLAKTIIVVGGSVPGLPSQLEAFRAALIGMRSHRSFLTAFAASAPCAAMRDNLLARKILLDPARRRRLDSVTWIPAVLLLAFGIARAAVGVSRGEPVGVLLGVMLAILVALAAVLGRERYLSRETRASLDALRLRRRRALRTPQPDELAFAFAMLGAVALVGTPHAGYAKLVEAAGWR